MSDMTTPPPEGTEPEPVVETPSAAEGAPLVPSPPPPSPAVASTSGGWGPPGKVRSWGVVAILTIITCGIYGIFWQYYVFEEN